MADDQPAITVEDDTPAAAADSRRAAGDTVAIVLAVLALVATALILLSMWNIGDMWPSGAGNVIPPCLPHLDHHCTL
jgi:hypothetical protein